MKSPQDVAVELIESTSNSKGYHEAGISADRHEALTAKHLNLSYDHREKDDRVRADKHYDVSGWHQKATDSYRNAQRHYARKDPNSAHRHMLAGDHYASMASAACARHNIAEEVEHDPEKEREAYRKLRAKQIADRRGINKMARSRGFKNFKEMDQ